MSTPNSRRKIRKARVVAQTQFDRQLMRVEQLVQEFHELIEQGQQSPDDREAIQTKLWAIRSRNFPEAVHSLEWALKRGMMRAFPMEANGL